MKPPAIPPSGPVTPPSSDLFSESSDISNRRVWSNKVDFVLSATGFVIGLGSLWRFPYLVYKYGGGTFLIPYCIAFVFIGLPILFLELIIGQYCGAGPTKAYGRLAPIMKGLGFSMLCLTMLVSVYYNVVLSWVIYYMFANFEPNLPWDKCVKNNVDCPHEDLCGDRCLLTSVDFFLSNMMGQKDGIEYDWCYFGDIRWPLVLCLLLAWTIMGGALVKGVQSSAKIVNITALFPFVVLIIFVVQSVTLDGAKDGIYFYLNPNLTDLLEPDIWVSASSQIFYTLSLGVGGMVTLSSYNNFNNDCHAVTLFVSLCNCVTSFLTGMAVFSTLGAMAKSTGQTIPDIVTGNKVGLTFMVAPYSLSRMPVPHLWCILFLIMLLSLGVDSMFGVLAAIITVLLEHFSWLHPYRPVLILITCLTGFALGLSMCTPNGIEMVELLDNNSITFNVLVCGFLEVVTVAWGYGSMKFWRHVEEMEIPVPRCLKWYWISCWSVFAPISLLLMILWQIYHWGSRVKLPRGISAVGSLLNVSVLCWIPLYAFKIIVKRWRKRKRPFTRTLIRPSARWRPSYDVTFNRHT